MLPRSGGKLTPLALLVSPLLVLCACSETTVQPNAPLGVRLAVAPAQGGDYIATPAGWYHRSCVHEIPNGAHVDVRGLVKRRDGRTFQIPKCVYPNYPNVPHLGGQGALVPPTDNDWVEDANYELGSGNSYHQLTAGWKVPAAPTGSYSGTQVYYSFPGLEDIHDSVVYIIQPVIQYGYNNYFGGSYWTAASWRCHVPNDCLHGTPITIAATDSVYGSVTASSCVNGTCTWTITIVDVTKGTRSDWTADATETYDWSTGGAVEVYGLNTCDQYPINGVFYSGLSLYDKYGSQVSPAWTTYIQPGLNPACNFQAVTPSATAVSLYHNRPPSASISGPTDITQAGTYTWTANPSGGVGTYSYAWQYRDAISPNWVGAGGLQSVSKDVSASTASWFDYQVIVTSGDQSSGQVSVHVINELGQCNPYCSPLP